MRPDPKPPWELHQECLGHVELRAKPAQHLRIILQNLDRLSVLKRADKSTQLLASIKDFQPDAMLMSELGLCWQNLDQQDSWHQQCQIVGRRNSRPWKRNSKSSLRKVFLI